MLLEREERVGRIRRWVVGVFLKGHSSEALRDQRENEHTQRSLIVPEQLGQVHVTIPGVDDLVSGDPKGIEEAREQLPPRPVAGYQGELAGKSCVK